MNSYSKIFYNLLIISASFSFGCSDSHNEDGLAPGDDDNIELPKGDKYSYIKVDYRKWQSGTFQSWSNADSYETMTIAGMNHFKPESYIKTTQWGGRLGLSSTTITGRPGFFRIAKNNNRYYLLDPDNGLMLLNGIQHVRPGTSNIQQQSFQQKFGTIENWAECTNQILKDNGINYISYGSNRIERFPESVYNRLLDSQKKKVAYAENLYLLRTFMWDMYKNLGYSFEDDKYNRLVLLFEPTFESYIDALAKEKCAQFEYDTHFIGYYIDNELPFASYKNNDPLRGIDIKHFLALPDKHYGARDYAEQFMQKNGIASVSAITPDHQELFRSEVSDYYYKITTSAIRRYDKNHLVLGSRLHDWSKYNKSVVEACSRYCDIVSINYYGRWQPEEDFLDNLNSWCDEKPFIISEFYVKGDDASINGVKYSNTDGGGWLVKTQKNRGEFHQNFALRLLQRQNCIGWIHFEYSDSYSSQDVGSNKGIVSLEYNPYDSFLSYMKQLNENIHSLIDYYDNQK